jgi:hypothetical protein
VQVNAYERRRVKQVTPYKTKRGAVKALDNGGRFYNAFSKADDAIVSSAELARAAGVFSADQEAITFFEMALMDLALDEREQVRGLLAPDLQARLATKRPRLLTPSVVEEKGRPGMPAIVTGYPAFVEDRTQFAGFIMLVVPVVMFIPITDQFDVYEVYDTPEKTGSRTVIATTRGSKRLDGRPIRFAGVLKELQFEDKTGKEHGLYLETQYYTPLG